MKLNLAIDKGNSASKVYLFDNCRLVESVRHQIFGVAEISNIFNQYDIDKVILSSVQCEDNELINAIKSHTGHFIELDSNTPSPLTIRYATPHTLGHDRIAAAVGAMVEAPGFNLLVIDAGTAVTLDVVNAQGEFLGGNISPGLSMRYAALHSYTDKLPMVDCNGDIPEIGYDTATAIRSGVVLGLVAEIDGYIHLISTKLGNLKVFITGGDSHFLVEQIKSPIFEDKNLLAKGLNRILLYNNENI